MNVHVLCVWCVTAFAVAAAPVAPIDPAGELAAAVDDIERHVAPAERPSTRYLSLYAVEPQDRERAAAAVSLVLNSVSRADVIVRPVAVADGGRLLRISLDWYGLPHDTWETLASRDPYWHIRTQVRLEASGQRAAGKATPRSEAASATTVFTDGGWVDLHMAARLRAMSGSAGALVRGDFFVAQAATTLDGGLYYDLAGVPEREADLFRLIGLDLATVGRLRADEGANLIFSRVTRKMRRVVRRQGPLGAAWHTYDVERSTAERDPIRNPFAFEYDAGEHIAAKRNGLHLFALYDAAGRRAASVPDVIAKDDSDAYGAGIIVPMLSCVRCHVEDGLRPFANDQRRLLAGGVELYAKRPQDALRLAAFYESNLDKDLARDREDYAEAVLRACGVDAAEAAEALSELYAAYADKLVMPAQAARELGLPPDALRGALGGAIDPVLLALAEGIEVQRQQFEAAFAEAALLAAGYRLSQRDSSRNQPRSKP